MRACVINLFFYFEEIHTDYIKKEKKKKDDE